VTRRRLYPDDLAERLKVRAGQSYRPSNGTEGEIFHGLWCVGCARDAAFQQFHAGLAGNVEEPDGCPIIVAAMAFAEDHPEYPREWQFGPDGQPVCTGFALDPDLDRTPRCDATPDLFGGGP
jgi:hypothetical protein